VFQGSVIDGVVQGSSLSSPVLPQFYIPHPNREVCCLPGVRDITRKCPSPGRPSDYYPLLLFHVGGDEVAVCSTEVIKRDFRAEGWLRRETGAQVVFSSLFPAVGCDIGSNGRTQSINTWLRGWRHQHNFGFFDNGLAYTAPGLLVSDGSHLSQRGKRVSVQELVGLLDRALNWICRGRVTISGLPVTSCGMMHNGWKDEVLVCALNLLPRGMLGTLQDSQSLAEMRWGLLRE